jgi:uncharacterized protein YbjT (DUF2867 family)
MTHAVEVLNHVPSHWSQRTLVGMSELTLVIGGTGKTGRRVAQRLADRGVGVRIGSRSGTPPFDWTDPTTWPAALAGATAVYLTYQPDLAAPGAAEAIGALSRLAVEAGARRLVLLSGRGEEQAWSAERAVRDAGVDWTILRASWFAQNFSEFFLLDGVRSGVVALPSPDVPEPFIDVEDIADVAVAALTGDGHTGRIYELTGPRALTFAEATAEIGAVVGREIRYLPVTVDEYAATATAIMPAEDARTMATLFAKVLDGRNSRPTDGVRKALGRDPVDFRAYVRQAAQAGAWS